jgi:signal transduction histidine kinase
MTYDFKDNIDELKDTREILEIINNELERKVKKRTKEINKLLEQKDDFIDQLGHDLKNPLGPLINLIPVLKKRDKNSENKEILDILDRNIQYMKNLVVKTIELAKLNSPNTMLNLQDTNLLEELNKVIDQNRLIINENNIKIINNINEKTLVSADKLRLTEVFTNLITNSVKYSKDSGTIIFDAEYGHNFVTISVKDDGIGMTKEQISHIFDEFYKADESRHDFDSSGLGMPICKRIIEKHGGRIWVKSDGIGMGSTFYFTLPYFNENISDK